MIWALSPFVRGAVLLHRLTISGLRLSDAVGEVARVSLAIR